ncbi:MAG: hypothetical protein IJQ12_01015 [Lachnospiraceae bacterium]|nr:hypothetical protein [Lachnospiraceae bacterium]
MSLLRENIQTLLRYAGEGFLFALYIPAFLYLWRSEREPWKRTVLLHAPLVLLVLFFLPPVTYLYRAMLDEQATYYRLLWLVPFGITIVYAGVRIFASHRRIAYLLMIVLFVTGGRIVYRSVHVTRAQNVYHLPQIVIDVCDALRADYGEGRLTAVFPPEMVHEVRQYDVDILLAFGRGEIDPSMHRFNQIHEAYVAEGPVRMRTLDRLMREQQVDYLVLHVNRNIDADPSVYGWEPVDAVGGYRIYRSTQ